MLTITKKLDMSPHGVPQVIRVSQYDSDFTLEFKLFASGGNFAISTGTTAEIRGTKQSGTGYSASATLDTSTKVVTVAGAAQMTAVAGMNIFEIVLKKNNKEISSANFCLLVERAALDADTITDESVLKELNAIIESADTATQAAEEAEDAADRAEAAAQTLVIDPAPIEGSAHAVSSGGVYDALQSAGLSEGAKTALLACFEHVAWVDGNGQLYYDALERALNTGESGIPLGALTTFQTGTAYFDRNNGYTTGSNNKRATCNISLINFNAGDMIKLSSTVKDTYQFLVGAAAAATTPNNRSWIRDGYSSENLVLQEPDIVDAKVILMRRSDNADISESDLETLARNILWVKGNTDIYTLRRIEYPGQYLTKINASMDMDTNSAKYGLKITEFDIRRNICFRYGKFPFYKNITNYPLMDKYPIPIPDDATAAKITITPSTQYMYIWQVSFVPETNLYQYRVNSGWKQGEYTLPLVTGYTNNFLIINTKYDSAGSSYPTEPSKIVIEYT